MLTENSNALPHLQSQLTMRTTILSTAVVLAVAATSAAARNCKTGLLYCGSALRHIGNYDGNIKKAIKWILIPHGETDGNDVLFECSDIFGNIVYDRQCGKGNCVDGGQGKSDYCR
ncbi:hypothetical protein GGX14DRAFT_575828 [Mycena pura]|uniref:Uncharacterized protein n=1 Tax=Mycena pura TaxID=153505 RepID=A0AAD6UUA3_9AGAR|nr:hypothetical protein GGX14DRAFT_575828 [Mycena pura]